MSELKERFLAVYKETVTREGSDSLLDWLEHSDFYGKTPKSLCFNCFRDKLFIIEPFKEQAYAESKEWLAKSIGKIREESDFKPSVEFFKCTHLCEMQDMCEYYELMRKR